MSYEAGFVDGVRFAAGCVFALGAIGIILLGFSQLLRALEGKLDDPR